MAKEFNINVVTRLQDNGDGGYTMWVYNDEDELIADHPMFEEFDSEKKKFYHREPTQRERNLILDEEDPYENGYIGSDTIKVKVKKDGTVKLAAPLSFHGGQ